MSHLPGPPDPDPPSYAAPGYRPPPGLGPPPTDPVPRTNGKAQAALWTGLALLLTSPCGLGLLGFVPIVLGVLARQEIDSTGGQQAGDEMALAGIVTGAVATVLSLVVIALAVLLFVGFDSGSSGYGTTGV